VSSTDLDGVFGALSDPTRRGLLERLVADGPDTATNLVAGLPVSRQAVVKHLQVLADAGLVTPERHGREVRYAASADPLGAAVGWMLSAGAQWDRRLERLRARFDTGDRTGGTAGGR
jgi:DNA-binding transcriptional ArsR family regulator